MKRSINRLIGFTLLATDGEIGKVKEFYFDDKTWTIRYLIVDTGNWLTGRVVLISPEALLAPDWENETFPINLTREQIKNSPNIDTDKPVSRQEEIKLHAYYPWIAYWGNGYLTAGNSAQIPGADPLAIGMPMPEFQKELARREAEADHHLRSTHQIKGYSIQATDGTIGDVEDFIIEETNWKIDFIQIDIGHWFSGKMVLLAPGLIREINWETASVIVETTIAHVKNSPEYAPDQELTEVYILANYDHYHNPVQ